MGVQLQGVFINWPVPENISTLAPHQNASTGPPLNIFKYENHIEVLRHLVFFSSWGGASLGLCRFFEIGYLPADT